MVKAYLRYVPSKAFGMIAGSSSNIIYHPDGKHIISACNEFVLIINMKTGDIVKELSPEDKHSEITFLTISNSKDILTLVAGYADGDIILWDLNQYEVKARLNGHKAAVTAACFNYSDSLLISGGADNNIIAWDVLSETALYKLSGHKNAITKLEIIRYTEMQGDSGVEFDFILSSSKDGLFKIWDLAIQDCVATVPGVTNEIWSFAVHAPSGVILLSSNTEEVQVIKLKVKYDPLTKVQQYYENIGIYQRKAVSRALEFQFDRSYEYLFILNSDKALEVHKIMTDTEAEKRAKRKKKRLREKNKEDEAEDFEMSAYVGNFLNRINHHVTQHFSHKVRSLAFPKTQKKGASIKFCVNLHNNALEVYDFTTETTEQPLKIAQKFEKLGHRTAVRAMAISSDDSMILTGSGECIKVWTSYDFQCIRTFESGWITSALFLPGDKYFVVGDKEGNLTVFDIDRAEQMQQIQAHEASVWSLHLSEGTYASKELVVLSGSADKKIKFWNIGVMKNKGIVNLIENKSITMVDEVHCVKFSADGKYYAVALMDSTMKIYFADSDRLFLSLYGHKLPVLSFDISTDGTLLVSGSADKNVKLWAMDFGNCKKSIYAHQDSIMKVSFVKDTHYFFSASKDRQVKFWDGDTYQLVMDFDFHLGEIWALGISSIGDFFVTASNDKSIRIWKQTKEQVFVSEEEEKRQEKIMVDNYAAEKLKNSEEPDKNGLVAAGEVNKMTVEHLKHGENLIEALEQTEKLREEYEQYEIAMKDYQALPEKQRAKAEVPVKPNLDSLMGKTIPEYILSEINKIRLNDLENCLKFLHFKHMEQLLYYLKYFIYNNISIELSTRVLYFILQSHENHIKNSKKLSTLLTGIQKRLRNQLEKEQNLIGMNISGLKMTLKALNDQSTTNIEEDSIFTQRFNFL